MLIACLGNPGKEYENTRHNIGHWAAAAIISDFYLMPREGRYHSALSFFDYRNIPCTLQKLLAPMNTSGQYIALFLEHYTIKPKDLLVILDDVNLPLGHVRLRPNGSDGGHNGLKSIISCIGPDFWRLRIGVGLPENLHTEDGQTLADYVLSEIPPHEAEILKKVVAEVPDIMALWIIGRREEAMGLYNGINIAETPNIDKSLLK